MSTATHAPDLVTELRNLLAPDRVISDPSELYVYDSDGFTIARATPGAVVFPTSTEEVVKVVKLLAERDVQIVPRGSGTGLTGGCVAFQNGVIVSTARMNKVLKIDLENRVAHVEAGVRNTALSDAVAQLPLNVELSADDVHDVRPTTSPARDRADGSSGRPHAVGNERRELANPYHFAPDPSSQRASTIGGNASTNAGGIHTLKDFVSSNHVLGMEVVLPDGAVINVGAADGCYEPGPFDLPGLICGHEGTFGIVTRLWVRLIPKATSFRTIVAVFNSTTDACNVVSEVIAAGILPAAMEMLDGKMIQIIEEIYHFGFPKEAQALLLTEIDGIDALLDGQMQDILDASRRHRAISVQSSADAATRAKLWKARKSAFGAIGKISPSYCTQDACVPRSMLGQVLAEVDRIGREFGLQINNVFHAGDGNVHPIFLYDDRSDEQMQNTLRAAEKVLQYCIDIGGTLTGEHGVGVEKIHLMPYLFDRATMEQFQGVKDAFDPGERINAGKLIPSEKVQVDLMKPGRHVPQ
ncbi:MAG TPA: FAD-linked oxidase C-terminal domain-containing protein [Tepidisphaeraceae bacterium]|nr:FAD-linked oxidase C-terminal domain-containing protein [Tepidisphaeraceae bacterium]